MRSAPNSSILPSWYVLHFYSMPEATINTKRFDPEPLEFMSNKTGTLKSTKIQLLCVRHLSVPIPKTSAFGAGTDK